MQSRRRLDIAMALISAKEAARGGAPPQLVAEPARPVKPPHVVKPQRVRQIRPSTIVLERANVTYTKRTVLVNREGSGVLQELAFKAESNDFEVAIYVDGNPLIYGSYDKYTGLSQEVKEVDAFEADGVYVFHAEDIEFEESLIITVTPTIASVSFTRIFVKYKVTPHPAPLS